MILSDLQKTILSLALNGRRSSRYRGADLIRAEILESYYGWEHSYVPQRLSGIRFSRAAIGEKKYNSAQVAVSRAVQRLERRGLIRLSTWPQGILLTDTGVKAAEELQTG
ncbi:MAG: hypothetical protein SYC29_02630 [Planctomycetota bacterium]|nr:hypothetical protein [Planctomycetota bacterium]